MHSLTEVIINFRVNMKKSATNIPRVELEEIGPSADFKLRRTKLASADLYKLACKQPKQLKVIKILGQIN